MSVTEMLHTLPGDFEGREELTAFLSAAVHLYGLEVAKGTALDLVNGKPVDLAWYDVEQASDLLSVLQNAESKQKAQFEGFINLAWAVLKPLIPGV